MASPIPCAKTGKTNEAVMLCHSFLLLREAEVLREREREQPFLPAVVSPGVVTYS